MKSVLFRLTALLCLLGVSFPLFAQDKTFDDRMNDVMQPVTEFIAYYIFYPVSIAGFEIPFVLIWLVVGALIFTIYMGFINIRGFKHALDVVRGKFDDPNDAGEVSHFQALTAALSGTVGVGNIAGVAVAVSLGGPGATFWMIVAGLIGMSAKFVECTLGLKYRKINPDGSISGGPMHYLSKGLAAQGKSTLGRILAALFAVACIGGSFGGGNMVQINQATMQFQSLLGESSWLASNGWAFGLVMAIVVGVIIIGGIKSSIIWRSNRCNDPRI